MHPCSQAVWCSQPTALRSAKYWPSAICVPNACCNKSVSCTRIPTYAASLRAVLVAVATLQLGNFSSTHQDLYMPAQDPAGQSEDCACKVTAAAPAVQLSCCMRCVSSLQVISRGDVMHCLRSVRAVNGEVPNRTLLGMRGRTFAT